MEGREEAEEEAEELHAPVECVLKAWQGHGDWPEGAVEHTVRAIPWDGSRPGLSLQMDAKGPRQGVQELWW